MSSPDYSALLVHLLLIIVTLLYKWAISELVKKFRDWNISDHSIHTIVRCSTRRCENPRSIVQTFFLLVGGWTQFVWRRILKFHSKIFLRQVNSRHYAHFTCHRLVSSIPSPVIFPAHLHLPKIKVWCPQHTYRLCRPVLGVPALSSPLPLLPAQPSGPGIPR